MRPTASSRLLVIVGDPVAHSISPAVHNAACRALAVDAVYVAVRVPPADLSIVTATLKTIGAAGNVTIPHKTAFVDCVDACTERARRLGAANTFWAEDGRLMADNTDVDGVLEATAGMQGPWLLVGTGGAARAAVEASRESGAVLRIRSRSCERATEFAKWARACGHPDAAPDEGVESDVVVINATPCGLQQTDPLPIAPADLARASAVMDMTYTVGDTPLVRAARAAGVPAVDGRTMLVAQAAASFVRFFPGLTAPLEVMRAAAQSALE